MQKRKEMILNQTSDEKEILAQKVASAINELKSLKEYKEEYDVKFENIYNSNGCSYDFYVFLNDNVLPIIGKEKLEKYFTYKANEYLDQFEVKRIKNVYFEEFGYHIFGHLLSTRQFLSKFKSYEQTTVATCFLRVVFPFICNNFKQNRSLVYKIMMLTKTEAKEYDEKYYANNVVNDHDLKTRINNMIVPDILKYGTHISAFYPVIDEYIEKIKISRRTLPNTEKDFFNEITDHICAVYSDKSLHDDWRFAYNFPAIFIRYTDYYNDKKQECLEYWFNHNFDELKENKTKYILYSILKGAFVKNVISIEGLSNEKMMDELRFFIRRNFNGKPSFKSKVTRVHSLLCYAETFPEVKCSADINKWHICDFAFHLEEDAGYKPSVIQDYIGDFRYYFNTLMARKNYPYRPTYNPTTNIVIFNSRDHESNTLPIPDDVIVFLDNHIDELHDKKFSLIYKCLMELGWRYSDVLNLTTDSFTFIDDSGYVKVRVPVQKTRVQLFKKGIEPFYEDLITKPLYEELDLYIKETQYLRDTYHTDRVFFIITNGNVVLPSSRHCTDLINQLLKKYNISSIDDRFVTFGTRQPRKTVATTLVSNGASLTAVQKKLKHTSSATTAAYYAEVQQYRLSELNEEFFNKKFGLLLDKDKLKLFSEEERKILYADFCLNKREVECGVCTKHPSEGRCFELGQLRCSSCPKLCTGEKYLPKWQQMLNDSKMNLDEYVRVYKEQGISESEYTSFIEYKQELQIFNECNAIIEAIQKGV